MSAILNLYLLCFYGVSMDGIYERAGLLAGLGNVVQISEEPSCHLRCWKISTPRQTEALNFVVKECQFFFFVFENLSVFGEGCPAVVAGKSQPLSICNVLPSDFAVVFVVGNQVNACFSQGSRQLEIS